MVELNQIYKCEICGNITEVVHASNGELVCCGQPMRLLQENTEDAAQEKHVPMVSQDGDTITVQVGEVLHPMEKTHYIEWIEILTETEVLRKYLHPGEKPEAIFMLKSEPLLVRAYCNIHGLWRTEV